MKKVFKIFAIVIALGVLLKLFFGDGEDKPQSESELERVIPGNQAVKVRVQTQEGQWVHREINISGRSEPDELIELKAEISGKIVELDLARGSYADQGSAILMIEPRDREARLMQAQALLAQREREFDASGRLLKEGYESEAAFAEARANLAFAKADLIEAELDFQNTQLRAPMNGFLHERVVSVGDYVQEGDPLVTWIVLDPLVVVGEVAEHDIFAVKEGMSADIDFGPLGHQTGMVSYVARSADMQSRTFTIEVSLLNPGGEIPGGITANILIQGEGMLAHRVSPALLDINKEGDLGLKLVDEDDTVFFATVELVKSDFANEIWVSGLPEEARIITMGQGFVASGDKVLIQEEQPVENSVTHG